MKLIVFDIDGTLTDSVLIHQEAFYEAIRRIGVDHLPEELNNFKHHTDSYIAKTIYETQMNHSFSLEHLNTFRNELDEIIKLSTIPGIKGASRLIKQLSKRNDVGICYATGSLTKPAVYKLESIGVSFESAQLMGSDHIYERENILSTVINNCKEFYSVSEFDRIISVGDGLWDLKTAKNLNLDFVGIGDKNKDIMADHGCTIHFSDLNNSDWFDAI